MQIKKLIISSFKKKRSDMIHARFQIFSSGVCGGGGVRPGPSGIKKSSDNVFYFFYFKFLVLNLFYRSPVVTFNENYHFPRF